MVSRSYPASGLHGLATDDGVKLEGGAFRDSVAAIPLDLLDLDCAASNVLYGRGALDRETRRLAVTAIKTLRDVIKAARSAAHEASPHGNSGSPS